MINFNIPYVDKKAKDYLGNVLDGNHHSGNGYYSKECVNFFSNRFGFENSLLTTSCTDALEMAAILSDVGPGDQVIVPSYTFVSTANAFALRGVELVFADSSIDNPNIDVESLESLITAKTKAIVVVHYAGVSCDMFKIQELCRKYSLYLIEDAAQAISSFYTSNGITRPLGTFGDLATFSFHETKNISCGEGGLLVVNNEKLVRRAEIIWEKGTDRSAYFRGEVDKYGWVDIGSSYLPSEFNAAVLYAQLEKLDWIQKIRLRIWNNYFLGLETWAIQNGVRMPIIPKYASNNAHMFYLVFDSELTRDYFISELKIKGVQSVFHYQSLHKSKFFKEKYRGAELPNSDMYSSCLVRLPLYVGLDEAIVINKILEINIVRG